MADAFGIDTILANVASIIAANETIGTVKDLPHVFSEVMNGAQIVEKTLETARTKLDNLTMASYRKVFPMVQQCVNDSTKLKIIFEKLENKVKQNPNQKSWGEVRVWYLEALEHEKGNRIECLLKTILERLEEVCLHSGVDLHTSIEVIDATLKIIDEAGLSLEDSEFNRGSSVYNQQTVQSGGFGQQNTPTGGQNTFNSGHNISGGTVTYGHLPVPLS